MAIPKILTARFEGDICYHVICKSIQKNLLFHNDENKRYFLQKFQHYLAPFIKTYAYCLLDNHVHFLIKVKAEKSIRAYLVGLEQSSLTTIQKEYLEHQNPDVNKLIERQFNSFFVSYTRSYNLYHKTKGHLFDSPFKRIKIDNDQHLTQTIIYIHANPLKHGFLKNFSKYKWSSYNSILSEMPTNLHRHEVLEWFGSKEAFIKTHHEQINFYYQHPLKEWLTLQE